MMNEAWAEARRIIEAVDAGDVSIDRLAEQCTSRLSEDHAIELGRRLFDALFKLLNTGIFEHETRHNQAVCRAILDRIEKASAPD